MSISGRFSCSRLSTHSARSFIGFLLCSEISVLSLWLDTAELEGGGLLSRNVSAYGPELLRAFIVFAGCWFALTHVKTERTGMGFTPSGTFVNDTTDTASAAA